MCATCGCGSLDVLVGGKRPPRTQNRGPTSFRIPQNNADTSVAERHHHHLPQFEQSPDTEQSRVIQVERDLFAKNNALATNNRNFFAAHNMLALNLVSSPGSGKTTLLVRTL
ncbi:MAG: hypothetical protein WCG35_05795, partial [Betaproteobacteria bacterium]